MTRAIRKIRAQETLDIIESGYYFDKNQNKKVLKQEIENAKNNTRFLTSEQLEVINQTIEKEKNFKTEIEVINEDSISAILRSSKEDKQHLMCLNFASAKNPGGGFLNGAIAQEESLAISSSLYACQMNAYKFYETHRKMKSCLYTDSMINSPEVPIFRNNQGNLLSEFVLCSFITSCAVNAGVVKRNEKDFATSITEVMDTRIEKMLSLCLKEKYQTLVLGAWGCGVFQNDPIVIAELFKKHIECTASRDRK